MSLAILFHFLCTQHVSDINISIIRNLRLFWWITTLVVLFLVRCVLEFRCGWVGVVSVLQAFWCHLLFYFTSYVLNMFRTLIYPSSGTCDYSVGLPHWSYCSWFDVCWSFGVVGLEWYPCCRLQPATRIPLQRGPIGPRWRKVAVPVFWPVPEAAVTVFSTPDDGCCDTRNV